MYSILLLTIVILLTPRLGHAAALTRLIERQQLPFLCAQIPYKSNLSFRDCINAIHQISHDAQNPQDLITFGKGPNVDVPIGHDAPLEWQYGTCEVRLQTSGGMPQTSSWQRIRAAATLLAHECAMIHKAGWFYFDRLLEDYQEPFVNTEGSGLQLWMGPRYGDPDEPESPPDQQKACKDSQQKSGFSEGLTALLHAAKIHPGSSRTLLNNTATGCLSVNGTNQGNSSGLDATP